MSGETAGKTDNSGSDLIVMLPSLIQQDISLHCREDDTDKIYGARVLEVDGSRLRISLPRCLVGSGYLRQSRAVTAIFVLGHRLFKCAADYNTDTGDTRQLFIEGEITATNRRNHARYSTEIHACYVSVSGFSLVRGQFANLRWKRSATVDISAGGILLQTPLQVPEKSYLLLNLDIPGIAGPLFIFGQVRWFGLSDIDHNQYFCGIRFLLREELADHFSWQAVNSLPRIMLNFDKKIQKKLEARLQRQAGHRKQGD